MRCLARRFIRRLERLFETTPVIPAVHHNPRRVPAAEVIRGRCWCGEQLTADNGRGWIDMVILHYRERHPDDPEGASLAEEPNRYSTNDKFKPKQW